MWAAEAGSLFPRFRGSIGESCRQNLHRTVARARFHMSTASSSSSWLHKIVKKKWVDRSTFGRWARQKVHETVARAPFYIIFFKKKRKKNWGVLDHFWQVIHFNSFISNYSFQIIHFNSLISLHSFRFIHFNSFQLIHFNSFNSIHSLQIIHFKSFIASHSLQVIHCKSFINSFIHSFIHAFTHSLKPSRQTRLILSVKIWPINKAIAMTKNTNKFLQ
jgi:hypothetical protein